jgi:hypothetical protein
MNLITYSLACLLTCTNWVLSCICDRLAKHASRIFVALFEMMPSEFIYSCIGWDRSLYASGDLLNLVIHFISYLSSWLLASYLVMVSLWWLTLVFASLGIMVVYNCLNTCLYLVKHPNFDLMHNISFFSRFTFDKFIAKGGEIAQSW